MLRSNLKFAFRFLKRDPFHSSLSILGFTIGLACAILILLYLQNELTYDQHNLKSEQIYRLGTNVITSGNPIKFTYSSPSLGPKLASEYPEIEEFVRIKDLPEILFEYEDKLFYEEDIVFADSNVFRMFTFDFIHGEEETSLHGPQSMVISRSLSKKYFGDENPIGKSIFLENMLPVTITGVVEDLPGNTHIPISGLINYRVYDQRARSMEWPLFEIDVYTYVVFQNGYDLDQFWEKYPSFYEKYAASDAKTYNQVYEPIFHKLSEIHYNSDSLRFEYPTGNKLNLYIFGAIGGFILILSIINYINMAMARAASRLKEIKIKKVCGSSAGQLMIQFMTESFLLVLTSLCLSIITVELILRFTEFNSILKVELVVDLVHNGLLQFGLIGFLLLVSLISGVFPALYLARSKTLSPEVKKGWTATYTRNFLVVFQFSVSIVVINLMLMMGRQLHFISQIDLGFDKGNVMTIEVRDTTVVNKYPVLKKQLLENPDINFVSTAFNTPGSIGTGLYNLESEGELVEHNFHVFFVNYGYLETLGLEIVSGRDFDENREADKTSGVIINEALAQKMNWDQPLGKGIEQFTYFKGRVIGVVKDFHFESLHQEIKPLIIRMQRGNSGNIILGLNKGSNTAKVISYLNELWSTVNPARPFIYHLLNDDLNELYGDDQAQMKLVRGFSILSIFISCIGLLGLTSYTVVTRTKEVGIRKALGATVAQILLMMFKSIAALVAIAFVIATTASFWLMKVWLDNFAYHTDIGYLIFIYTGFVVLGLAWLTVIYHFQNVAKRNPVEALRYE